VRRDHDGINHRFDPFQVGKLARRDDAGGKDDLLHCGTTVVASGLFGILYGFVFRFFCHRGNGPCLSCWARRLTSIMHQIQVVSSQMRRYAMAASGRRKADCGPGVAPRSINPAASTPAADFCNPPGLTNLSRNAE
jgi:hypothetical protein